MMNSNAYDNLKYGWCISTIFNVTIALLLLVEVVIVLNSERK